ncbi:MAG: hypothetical protein M3014_11135 [Chloroflexota bacterium]|nr:hypothetical protein [Chloroflexota bacterium]
MADSSDSTGHQEPQSPEVQAPYVREELDQEFVTHQGEWRTGAGSKGSADGMSHLGATDEEVVPIVSPMSGPADLVGEKNIDAQGNETGNTQIGEEEVDPRDLLTPG